MISSCVTRIQMDDTNQWGTYWHVSYTRAEVSLSMFVKICGMVHDFKWYTFKYHLHLEEAWPEAYESTIQAHSRLDFGSFSFSRRCF
jgi:hypothetical protein